MRHLTASLALLLALAVGLPAQTAAASPATNAKVVIIVGPVGDATDRYRARAREAAAAAHRHSANVVEIHSPGATWPVVREALQGASVVVYLGHGNGWPSIYRDSPNPATQNGFGLNPVSGVDDDAHQYFGESWIAREVRLARDAVVILSGLCYASGNTEPDLPEGTLDDAKQRVDNYAAGFIVAGASAVIADAHVPSAWYVERILSGTTSIERLWRDVRGGRGEFAEFASVRSQGFAVRMNPDRKDGGYYRSLVVRSGQAASAGTATQPPKGNQQPPAGGGAGPDDSRADEAEPGPRDLEAAPSLMHTGLQLETGTLSGLPRAGTTVRLSIPFAIPDRSALPASMMVGTRWDPLEVAVTSSDPARPEPLPDSLDGQRLTPGVARGGGDLQSKSKRLRPPGGAEVPPPTPSPEAAAAGNASPLPDMRLLVQPERRGSLVTPVQATLGAASIEADIDLPALPGRYRLILTLHDGTGIAFDEPTQDLVDGLLVRVVGSLGASYDMPPKVAVPSGSTFRLPIGVTNLGGEAWGESGDQPVSLHERVDRQATRASLAARWVPLAPGPATARAASSLLPAGLAPGTREEIALVLDAPESPGVYLLVIDVFAPGVGSLAAHGVEPGLLRVTVSPR
jgi:hypothetical protein